MFRLSPSIIAAAAAAGRGNNLLRRYFLSQNYSCPLPPFASLPTSSNSNNYCPPLYKGALYSSLHGKGARTWTEERFWFTFVRVSRVVVCVRSRERASAGAARITNQNHPPSPSSPPRISCLLSCFLIATLATEKRGTTFAVAFRCCCCCGDTAAAAAQDNSRIIQRDFPMMMVRCSIKVRGRKGRNTRYHGRWQRERTRSESSVTPINCSTLATS